MNSDLLEIGFFEHFSSMILGEEIYLSYATT
jgi:hypothetical protein